MTTREKILTATLELASEQGLGQVSLSQIAKKVGIQKASIYNHFDSKDAIILGLYEHLRFQSRAKANVGNVDYGEYVKGRTAFDILNQTVKSYITMNQDPDMEKFYKFIMSERSIRKEAANIMVVETEKMIIATKQLFYAMQVHQIMAFTDIDMAALSFAMSIHSIIDYIGDQRMAGVEVTAEKKLDDYLKEFCRVYGNDR